MVILAYRRDGLRWDEKNSRKGTKKKVGHRGKDKMKEDVIQEKNRNHRLTQI